MRDPSTPSTRQAAARGDDLTKRNVEQVHAMEAESNGHRTFGDRIADGFARVVGSWTFIIVQSFVLAAWIVVNVIAWMKHWDPYPFILLNLGLSFQAAFASPIIMMSQNRQALLSERRNRFDLQVNLLAEQENTEMLGLLRKLCEKSGIDLTDHPELEQLAQPTEPAKVMEQLEAIDDPSAA